MTWPAVAVEVAYYAVLSLLALYGLHRLSLVLIYLRHRRSARRAPDGTRPETPASHPVVTVQLPIYNELYVVERLIDAACALRYPVEALEIQVLDDSTDGTSALAARLVASYRARGRDIHHLRRERRDGYKAGALARGLAAARGELIAVFDADFVPPPDFLELTVPRFVSDAAGGRPRLGMLQARWGHINRDDSLLTRAQALMLDGHFVIEHAARAATGRFLNFNGTAGIFRRACIEQAGGWQDDTLTEDLDLSYRAQLAGWRFEHMPDLVVPGELPGQIRALRSQQRRWARGSIQTALKLIPRVLAARLPASVKIEAMAHLTNNAAWLLLAMLAVLIVPALAAREGGGADLLRLDLPLFLAGTGSFALFCAVAQRETRRTWWRELLYLPALTAIGVGLCLNNALAVIEALGRRPAEFHRTPKLGAGPARAGRPARSISYGGPRSGLVVAEAALAVWFAVSLVEAARLGRFACLPFLLLFETGFLYVTWLSLAQDLFGRFRSDPPVEAPAP